MVKETPQIFQKDEYYVQLLQDFQDICIIIYGCYCIITTYIFFTMTCNPSWPEIEEHLFPTDEVQNKPDLVSRVFREKTVEL